MYVVATSRSFRTSRLAKLVGTGGSTASVRASVREDDERREQSVGIRVGMRSVRVDGKRPPTLAAFAVKTPVVVFHPGAVALSAGSGADRRRLLDRLALYLGPASIADAEAYGKAARARQRVLESRGPDGADLAGWEELMVRHGLALSEARGAAAERLGRATSEAFARIGAPGSALVASYQQSSPREAERFREALARSRLRDRARGSASVGPHRDDLALELGGRPVRGFASQGQHRAIVLSLELTEMHVIGEARGVWPILLLDDVSSELDDAQTSTPFADARRSARSSHLDDDPSFAHSHAGRGGRGGRCRRGERAAQIPSPCESAAISRSSVARLSRSSEPFFLGRWAGKCLANRPSKRPPRALVTPAAGRERRPISTKTNMCEIIADISVLSLAKKGAESYTHVGSVHRVSQC